jgi:hypothetical protein
VETQTAHLTRIKIVCKTIIHVALVGLSCTIEALPTPVDQSLAALNSNVSRSKEDLTGTYMTLKFNYYFVLEVFIYLLHSKTFIGENF